MLSEVKIVSDGVTTHVEVDGVDMSKAGSVTYQHIAGQPPTVTLTLPVDRISIDCVAEIRVEK